MNPGVDRGTVVAAFDALDAAFDEVDALPLDTLTHPELLSMLNRLERLTWRVPSVGHRIIARLAAEASPTELGGTSLANALSVRLRISGADAQRRVRDAAALGPRTALSGEPLEPLLIRTAAAQSAGQIGPEHVRIIRKFIDDIPDSVDYQTREQAEATLASAATEHPPEGLRKAADRLLALIHPDGDFSDADRARKRSFTIGNQQPDGMSEIRGRLSPEARATWEAVLATWAAPGMCNPDDESPCVDGDPGDAAAPSDLRSPAQRNHDAMVAVGRAMLGSGKLGQHNGLPSTIIVSTTLKELEAGTGHGVTAGGTLLPMSDVIRLATHSYHYLSVFDEHTSLPLYLGRSRRTASPGQRIVLHAKDRGCSHPGCDAPGYRCEVHHIDEWADDGPTDIDKLTFACKPHHRQITQGGWRTRKRSDGRTVWIPPPHLDSGQSRVNGYHHPERMLLAAEKKEDGHGRLKGSTPRAGGHRE